MVDILKPKGKVVYPQHLENALDSVLQVASDDILAVPPA